MPPTNLIFGFPGRSPNLPFFFLGLKCSMVHPVFGVCDPTFSASLIPQTPRCTSYFSLSPQYPSCFLTFKVANHGVVLLPHSTTKKDGAPIADRPAPASHRYIFPRIRCCVEHFFLFFSAHFFRLRTSLEVVLSTTPLVFLPHTPPLFLP